ncbi:MAG TPA: FAD-dependent oxidoreductase [Bacteroidota bacterium]
MTRRIVVIGGLAAGPSAASKAVRTNPNAEVVLFEQGENISYGICEIPYYIGGEFPEDALTTYTPQTLKEKKGVSVKTLNRVEEIQPAKRTIQVRDLKSGSVRTQNYDRLVIATGSKPKSLRVPGEDARNVFHVKTLSEGVALNKYLQVEKPRSAVIIGAGYIGMEMADALRSLNISVTMLHRHTLPMSTLERSTREMVRSELEEHGIRFIAHAKTEGLVVGKKLNVTHVVTNNGTYEADVVILALGVAPCSDLAAACGIRTGGSGGILTDQRQMTNIDNVFAAGDCCEVKSIIHNRNVYIPLATIASKCGWVAGENAAGGNASFRGAVRSIALRVFDLEVAQVGLSAQEARDAGFDVLTETITAWSRVAKMPKSSKVTITTIADKASHRLLGANLFGKDGVVHRANTLAVAVQHKIPIDDMQQWDLAYSPPFTPLWDPIVVAANATRKKL